MKTKVPNWLEQDPQDHCAAIESSPIGKLPAELRLHVYSFLVEPGTIHIWREHNILSNSLCQESLDDTKSFGPHGTLQSLIDSKEYNQSEVATEAACRHVFCTDARRLTHRYHVGLSLFHTCRLLYMEAKPLIDAIYSRSTFYFLSTAALERFVDNISPHSRSLLQRIHLTLSVSHSYNGIHRPLIHTLNRLQPNPYVSSNEAAHGLITNREPRLRLRIKFRQYKTDDGFDMNLSPSISLFIARLPVFLFRSILVIVPSLPIPTSPTFHLGPSGFTISGRVAPRWYTKLVPSHHPECLAEIVTSVMEARVEIRRAQQGGRLGPNQWLCGDSHGARGVEWWEEGRGEGRGRGNGVRRDIEVKFTVVFGV